MELPRHGTCLPGKEPLHCPRARGEPPGSRLGHLLHPVITIPFSPGDEEHQEGRPGLAG